MGKTLWDENVYIISRNVLQKATNTFCLWHFEGFLQSEGLKRSFGKSRCPKLNPSSGLWTPLFLNINYYY